MERRVCVFPGGGIFGLISINAVRHFLIKQRTTYLDFFSASVGVSIGALNSILLSYGMIPDELRKFYTDPWKKFKPCFIPFKAVKTLDPIEKKLNEVIGNTTMASCKIPTLILRLNRLEKRISWCSNPGNENVLMRDAILSSCSEPCVFPGYYPESGGAYGGGGLSIFNKPLTAALMFSKWLIDRRVWSASDTVKYYIFDTGKEEIGSITMKEARKEDWLVPRAQEALFCQTSGIEADVYSFFSAMGVNYELYQMGFPYIGPLGFIKEENIPAIDAASNDYFKNMFNP